MSVQATATTVSNLSADDWLVYCDGSAYPNPGRMGCGAVLIAPTGNRYCLSQASSFSGCNNEAELRSVCMAARALLAHGAPSAIFFTDSLVVVEHLRPTTSRHTTHKLALLVEEAKTLVSQLNSIQWQWVPRHRNTEADTLARAALGLAPKIKRPAGRIIKRPS